MNPNQALWEKGDFTRIASTMRESGEAAHAVNGQKVLDLGCGDGTTALGFSARRARRRHRGHRRRARRAKAAGLANLRFQQGDACDLEVENVVDVRRAIARVRPIDVAKSMVNDAPGRAGRDGEPRRSDEILKISFLSAAARGLDLGVEDHVIQRFAGAGVPKDKVALTRETSSTQGAPKALVSEFRHYYVPTMNAFDMRQERKTELQHELEALFEGKGAHFTRIGLVGRSQTRSRARQRAVVHAIDQRPLEEDAGPLDDGKDARPRSYVTLAR